MQTLDWLASAAQNTSEARYLMSDLGSEEQTCKPCLTIVSVEHNSVDGGSVSDIDISLYLSSLTG